MESRVLLRRVGLRHVSRKEFWLSAPQGIATGPDGGLWFAEAGNKIGEAVFVTADLTVSPASGVFRPGAEQWKAGRGQFVGHSTPDPEPELGPGRQFRGRTGLRLRTV